MKDVRIIFSPEAEEVYKKSMLMLKKASNLR